MPAPKRIDLADNFALITEHWWPKVVAELNGQEVKLVKLLGTFTWHHHEQEREDELVLVVAGVMRIAFRYGAVTLTAPGGARL